MGVSLTASDAVALTALVLSLSFFSATCPEKERTFCVKKRTSIGASIFDVVGRPRLNDQRQKAELHNYVQKNILKKAYIQFKIMLV